MYGPLPPRRLPPQNADTVRLVADRWWRDSADMRSWSETAKECVDFFEGRQWTQEQIAALDKQRRPHLTFNKIAPLVRLIAGYMRNNRTDIKYLPANEGPSTEDTADVLSKVAKQISEMNQEPWVDAEVFMDGIVTGRGYWDQRLDFQDNDHGEVRLRALDPFTVVVDSECEDYDIGTKAKRFTISRWASLDEIEISYGPEAADAVRPFIGTTQGQTWGGFPHLDVGNDLVTPVRSFGEVEDPSLRPFQDFFNTELIDRTRKQVRVIDQQHAVVKWGPVFIDLETGDKVAIPETWARAQIEKALYHAEQIGNPVVVDRRPVRRIRWTVLIGDMIVHDSWSPYDNFTITGYFPYFRRGKTRGMVEDLIDPQREINKRRSAEIDIVTRTANSGWLMHEKSIPTGQEQHWKQNSAQPGFVGTWTGDGAHMKPDRIEPSPPPTSMERLEDRARNDTREISGINESALGELDRVQSGRAIEARQRQAVIAVQMYMDNFSRSKELIGRRRLEIVQKHYTEERMFRIVGEDGRLSTLIVNQSVMDPITGEPSSRKNDITIGKYSVAVDETPLSASFANAQFEEVMMLLEKMGPLGAVLMQTRPDLVVDLSSLPRKKEWAEALRMASSLTPPGGPPAPGGGGPGVPNAPSLDQGTAPGGNVVPMPTAGAGGR